MAEEIKIWKIEGDLLREELEKIPLDMEKAIENWIMKDIKILSENLIKEKWGQVLQSNILFDRVFTWRDLYELNSLELSIISLPEAMLGKLFSQMMRIEADF